VWTVCLRLLPDSVATVVGYSSHVKNFLIDIDSYTGRERVERRGAATL